MLGTYLKQLGCERIVVKVGFRQHFNSIFAAVFRRLVTRRSIVEVHAPNCSNMAVVRRQRARKNLTHEVHDSVTAGTELPNDLKLLRRFIMIDPRLR